MQMRSTFLAALVAFIAIVFCSVETSAQATPDPGLPGAYLVAKDTFDLGDLAFKPDSFANFVELRGSVHYPASLAGGPFPVIVLLHGRHSTVFKTGAPGTSGLSWPPPAGYESIISFDGYDYFARTMASHGYIVISVSCNAINAADNARADRGMNARGQLMQKHLDLWKGYNTIGGAPFGTKFVGKLDMNKIGTMGHSRGGEGVVFHALLNKSLGTPYGIKAVLTLAPVDFSRKVLNGIPLMNIAPYCDGDVTTLSGVRYYDDGRYNDTADDAPKYSVLMMGANHNFYNTVWTPGSYIAGTSDDWDSNFGASTDGFCGSKKTGNGRLDTTKQKAAFNAYAAAFFRMHIGGDTSFSPILELDDIHPPVSSLLDTTQVYVSYHPGKNKRRDINRTDTVIKATSNDLGAAVTTSGLVLANICGAGYTMPSCTISSSSSKEPHKGTATVKGLGQMNLSWNDSTDFYQNEIPDLHQNVTGFESIIFRTAVNYALTKTGKDLDFSVQLVDTFGNVSSQNVNAISGALFFQPGTQTSVLPKIMFNSVKIPLNKFKGVNQTKLKQIRFLFNKADTGAVLVSDLAFEGYVAAPCGLTDAQYAYVAGTGFNRSFVNESIENPDDSVVYRWNFGDIGSGVNDTSSLRNPVHLFSVEGNHTACLYLSAYRSNGLICRDTICKTISIIPKTGLQEQSLAGITIIPNPAKDYLMVAGALASDVFELKNMCGQTVLNTTLFQAYIPLPSGIPAGIYFGIVKTQAGNKIQKIVITK